MHCPVLAPGPVLGWPALTGAGVLPVQASVPKKTLALITVAPGPPLVTVVAWDTWLAPNVVARLAVRFTVPAKRLPAQAVAGSPMRMGTAALDTPSAWRRRRSR